MSGVNWDSTKKVMECQSCDTVTLMMISYKIVCRSKTTMSIVPKRRSLKFSKVSTFNFKILVEAPIFTRNKLHRNDPNDELYPLVQKLKPKNNY